MGGVTRVPWQLCSRVAVANYRRGRRLPSLEIGRRVLFLIEIRGSAVTNLSLVQGCGYGVDPGSP
jgi:hypothetical protein